MSRKNKGAALFELLHRDKGKATTADGSLKMPSWFRTKSQPTSPKPGEPVEPELDDVPDPQPSSAEPGDHAAGPAPSDAQPVRQVPPPATARHSAAAPAAAALAAHAAPAAPTANAAPPVPAGPARLVPPWANGPWLQVDNGRVRINITAFAGYVVLGVAGCVLLMAFLLGRLTVRQPKVEPAVADNKAVGEVQEAAGKKPDPSIVKPDAGRTNPNPNPDQIVRGGDNTANQAPLANQTLPAGNHYVNILAGSNKDACDKVCQYLRDKGFDVIVSSQQNRHTVRTRIGADRPTADRLCQELDGALLQLSRERRGLISYTPGDPSCKPYVVNW